MAVQVLNEKSLWLLDSAPNAMLIVDAAGRISYSNQLAEELFGYACGELQGCSIESLLPPWYSQELFCQRQPSLPDRRGFSVYGRRKDGSEVAVEVDLSHLQTPDGHMTMAAIRDIAARQRSRDHCWNPETHLEHIVDSINDVVWSISPSGDQVLYVNSAWERVFGHSHQEAQNNPGLWLQTIHPNDRRLATEALAALLAQDQLDLEYRIVRPDGEVRWISDHATVLRDANGNPVRIDGIGRDITRHKQSMEHQAALMHELEIANEELKNFAYVVSHDLKAPLRAICSLAEWIATDYADKFDEEGKEQLSLLVGRVRRMNSLIDGILQYSRVGRGDEKCSEVKLEPLLQEVIDLLAPPEHVRIAIETSMPAVQANPTRMQQVLQNLLANAIKYNDKPQGEVRIGCMDDGRYWKFYVRDNGPGIEQRYFERIFQLFQTLMPRDRLESTGVGLALVKKIVEMYDGNVWLESTMGEGSTFYFTLLRSGQDDTQR